METFKVQPLDYMQYINTKYHEPFIHTLIEFEVPPASDRLRAAVAALADAFPLLKCRYDGAANVFAENGALTPDDLFLRDDGADIGGLLTERLALDRQLFKLTLCKDVLVATVCHMVCDGSGFKKLLYLLCRLYNGHEAGDCAALLNRQLAQLTGGMKHTGAATARMLFSMLGGYKNRSIYQKGGDESVHIVQRVIDSQSMQSVHAAAKRRGATLNDVFLTAYARAAAALCGRERINIPCTVDLRKYAAREAGIANLTGTYALNVKIREKDGFLQTLDAVSKKMRAQKGTKNDIAGPMLLVSKYESLTLERFTGLYGGMNTGALTDYTNLGILDENKLFFKDAAVKNAVAYSGLNKAPCFQLAVSSFKGATTFSSLIFCCDGGQKKAEELLTKIAEEILSFGN